MSTSSLIPFLILGLIAWLWLDGARAREFANALAERHCRVRGLQLLDQTVALVRVGLRWTSGGLRIRRMFRFDFSLEGAGRRTGYVLLLGTRLETIDDGLQMATPDDESTVDPSETKPADTPKKDGVVVPFRRRKD